MENKKKKIGIAIGLIGVVLATILTVHTSQSAIYNALNDAKLIPIPEHFTELYFTDPNSLPTQIAARQPISFAFTIHNVEGVTTTYPYDVYFEYPNNDRITLTRGIATLSDNSTTTITVPYTFSVSNLTGKIVVNMPEENNQQIDFVVPNTNF